MSSSQITQCISGVESTRDAQLQDILPPASHPNYDLWHNYNQFAPQRGALVADILGEYLELNGARILDVGCGIGGTSFALTEHGAFVVAVDIDPAKLRALRRIADAKGVALHAEIGDVGDLHFSDAVFDAVILQDVLEHVGDPRKALSEVTRVLRNGGVVFLSTPNRWSPFNLLSDPHWQLPLVAALSRRDVSTVVHRLTGRAPEGKLNVAALFSLRQLRLLLNACGLKPIFMNRAVVQHLSADPRKVLSSRLHLRLASIASRIKASRMVTRIVNNRLGLFNHIINPTWYILARKP